MGEFDTILRERVVPVVQTCYALEDEDIIKAADCMQVGRGAVLVWCRGCQPTRGVGFSDLATGW